MIDREEIANKLADEGWCPDSTCEPDGDGYLITKTMYISNSDIDQYIAENFK